MPTNVTQKDKTLKQVIDYCEKKMNDLDRDLDILADNSGSDAVYYQAQGQMDSYEDIALKCRHLCRKAIDNAD